MTETGVTKRSKNMAAIRSSNTAIERLVRSKLHSAGFRYRLHRKDLPGKPDLVLPRYRTVVLVNGCFWHGHDCTEGHTPKSLSDALSARGLPNLWVPGERDFFKIDQMPLLGSGKLDLQKLKQMAASVV